MADGSDLLDDGLPAAFDTLSASEQKKKLAKRRQIERNWQCGLQDCLPPEIRPRQLESPRRKAMLGELVPEAFWWMWSVKLLACLHQLSALTVGKLTFAQELLSLEVQQRQCSTTHSRRHVAELLTLDVRRVVLDLQESSKAVTNSDIEGMDSNDEDEDASEDEETLPTVRYESSEKAIPEDSNTHATTDSHAAQTSRRERKKHAAIAMLRAKAMRMRQEAARLEAEAYEREAKMFS